MDTKKQFKQDVYLTSGAAKITKIIEENGRSLIQLDQTIFFPTGGGQSCDIGTINHVNITDVFENHGQIYHCTDQINHKLLIGDEVSLSIDWAHRFDNMQRHCGEHILSGIFFALYGGVNRGFHMGDDYMTIDISLEENPDFTKITWEMAKEVELSANRAIWANLPVITRDYAQRQDTDGLPLRKAVTLDENITIVCVGAVENPADCVACCGTHPSTAGQVGMIKIYKVEGNKGMFRIYFDAGQRAFHHYQETFDVMTVMEGKLSAGGGDLLAKYDAQQEKNKEVRTQLYQLKKRVIADEIQQINRKMKPAFVKKYDTLSINDILDISKGIMGNIPTIAFLVHQPSNTVLLFSDTYDCGKLVKDNAGIYSGKGGGNKNASRAIFPKAEYIDTFIDLIEKHIR